MTAGVVVRQLWRYPFKSMLGEPLAEAWLGPLGLLGDRAWAVRDEVRGGIRGAKQLGGLMGFAARYLPGAEPLVDGPVMPVEITGPDGSVMRSDDPAVNEWLSGALDHPVTVWPLQPADDLQHYRRGLMEGDDPMAALRAVFALEPDDPLPDFSRFPSEIAEFESPPGTYLDAWPLLVLSEQSLASLQALAPESAIDVRRFRPNLLIDAPAGGPFPETSWAGRSFRVGGAVIEVLSPCPRCVMVTRAVAELPSDRSIMRTLVRETGQDLGAYARVVEPGAVRSGDLLEPV